MRSSSFPYWTTAFPQRNVAILPVAVKILVKCSHAFPSPQPVLHPPDVTAIKALHKAAAIPQLQIHENQGLQTQPLIFRASKNPQIVKTQVFEDLRVSLYGGSLHNIEILNKHTKKLATQGVLTYCTTRPSRVSTYTSGSSCLSLRLL